MEHRRALAVAGGVALLTFSSSLGWGATNGLLGFGGPKRFGRAGTLALAGPFVPGKATPIGGWSTFQPAGSAFLALTTPPAMDAAGGLAAGPDAAWDQIQAGGGQTEERGLQNKAGRRLHAPGVERD